MSDPVVIKLVYQDCPMCGARRKWGDRQLRVAAKEGIVVQKVSFTQIGASDLIMAAAKSGVSLPFFTDGTSFAKNLADLLAEVQRDAKKAAKKAKKKAKVEDGATEPTA